MRNIGWRYERFAALVSDSGEALEVLATLPGVQKSKETVRKYMTGEVEPQFRVGMALARHFNVHPHFLGGLRDTRGTFPREEVAA